MLLSLPLCKRLWKLEKILFTNSQGNLKQYKVNKIVNKFLLAKDKFMPQRQPGFTYSGLFRKNKQRIQQLKESGDLRYTYQNKLDKTCFQNDMAHEDFKELPRIAASDKVLREEAFAFAKNPKYDASQWGLASIVYIFLIKSLLLCGDG